MVALAHRVPASWQGALADVLASPGFHALSETLAARLSAGERVLPPAENWFAALEMVPPEAVRVVILGQDPYPTPGHAHGLSFSVAREVQPLPKSLVNIFRELRDDIGVVLPDGALSGWARQGVLLLNAVLTVSAGMAGSHQKLGWEALTDEVIRQASAQPQSVVFILWGAHAQKKAALIDDQRHLVLVAPHPSPLSSYRGFFGSQPFSKTNSFLEACGQTPIDWGASG